MAKGRAEGERIWHAWQRVGMHNACKAASDPNSQLSHDREHLVVAIEVVIWVALVH